MRLVAGAAPAAGNVYCRHCSSVWLGLKTRVVPMLSNRSRHHHLVAAPDDQRIAAADCSDNFSTFAITLSPSPNDAISRRPAAAFRNVRRRPSQMTRQAERLGAP
jgi:hypothetical protein